MIRGLALTVSFLAAGVLPALAQTHPYPHPATHPHQGEHPPVDSAWHAAMHARLMGSWEGEGSFRSAHDVASGGGLSLSVAHDSLGKLTLRMSADQPIRAGAASNFMVNGDTLHWTQELSGAPCQATARLSAATPHASEIMEGRMACELGEVMFTLHKKTR